MGTSCSWLRVALGLHSVWWWCSLMSEGWKSTPRVVYRHWARASMLPSHPSGQQDHTGHLRTGAEPLSIWLQKPCSKFISRAQSRGLGRAEGACWHQGLLLVHSSLFHCHLQFYLLKCLFSKGTGEGVCCLLPPVNPAHTDVYST